VKVLVLKRFLFVSRSEHPTVVAYFIQLLPPKVTRRSRLANGFHL